MQGILGKKLGMTQIYDDSGAAIPVTILEVGPCVVVQRKTTETDGYEAAQVGLLDDQPNKANQPTRGHFEKAGVKPVRRLVEFGIREGEEVSAGDQFDVGVFLGESHVDIVGTAKGKGFQGVMKRHNFAGGRATHGSMFHRSPGAVGQSADPSRVFPNMRFPGHMGDHRVKKRGVRVVKIDGDKNLMFVKGPVPGGRNGYVEIHRSYKSTYTEPAQPEADGSEEAAE
ncbi:MAG: 50S ribosomal protein L3 [Acidobacteriota bacterium]